MGADAEGTGPCEWKPETGINDSFLSLASYGTGSIGLNFYFGFDGVHAQEGFAVSKDLIHWEKAEKPILPYGEERGAYDSRHAHKASVIAVNGVLYHFYCGVRPRQEGDIPGIL